MPQHDTDYHEDREDNEDHEEGSGSSFVFFVLFVFFVVNELSAFLPCARAADVDELRVKREEVFEFAAKPKAIREGDKTTLSFETKGFCDCTVAIEDAQGRILRHLACGVLGPNAPQPFQRNSKQQTLVWDGKDDRDVYVGDPASLTVRVSLGLQPQFEKNLFWEPKRRHGREPPIFQSTPEGMYVYDGGNGLDFVKLYDHDGRYMRTAYPFPASQIDRVKGLQRQAYPPDGQEVPLKPTFLQQTFLTSGNFYGFEHKRFPLDAIQACGDNHYGMYGNASSVLAVSAPHPSLSPGGRGWGEGAGRIALGMSYLFRFATDGSSGGLDVEGPPVSLTTMGRGWDTGRKKIAVAPRSAALSPDGKTLYLTGYSFCHYQHATVDIITGGDWDAFHCVLKMDLEGDSAPTLFAGDMEIGKCGSDNRNFTVPASVAVDKAGRVYVGDYMNDRVQIFAPDGKYLKTVPVLKPAVVSIHARTQELYVFTAWVNNRFLADKKGNEFPPGLTVFGPFDNPQKKLTCPLPGGLGVGHPSYLYSGLGFPLSAAVDGFSDPPTVWLASEWPREHILTRGKIQYTNVQLYTLEGGALKLERDFDQDVVASVKRTRPAPYARPRLYVNPKTGKLYVGEGEAFDYKSFKSLIEIDPDSGQINIVPIPFDAEDMCFDMDGCAYLRNIGMVVRYDSATWREIPWDYGEEQKAVHTSSSSDRKEANALSGLPLPANGGWHHGGMFVSARGNLAVACGINLEPPKEKYATGTVDQAGRSYRPTIFPGRNVEGRGGAPLIHIWDKHGKLLREDVLPGICGNTYGLGLGRDNTVTMMLNSTRVLDGSPYPNPLSGTILKAAPGKARLVSTKALVPLGDSQRPNRAPDLRGYAQDKSWVEGAEWLYGGVGYDGKNAGVGCGCWNARMAFDYFGRTFAPELQRYRIAVLDASGNLMLRIGRYGNCDSAGPGSLEKLGGDEVGLMHGAYLATLTDRRLFVADPANDRIISVKLGYHAEERVPLKQDK